MKTELFKKVYIRSEADLPKEEGRYIIHHKRSKIDTDTDSYAFIKGESEDVWMYGIDWYLQPVEQEQPLITEQIPDTSKNAKQYNCRDKMHDDYCPVRGAKLYVFTIDQIQEFLKSHSPQSNEPLQEDEIPKIKTFEQILKDAGILNEDDILNRNYEACAEIYASQFQQGYPKEFVEWYSLDELYELWQNLKELEKRLDDSLAKETPESLNSYFKEPQPLQEDETFKAESLHSQVDRLAKFIIENCPGYPNTSEGAIDCAIRIIKSHSPQSYQVPSDEDVEKAANKKYQFWDNIVFSKLRFIEGADYVKSQIKAVEVEDIVKDFQRWHNSECAVEIDDSTVDEYLSQRETE